jgi:hypothetical protein
VIDIFPFCEPELYIARHSELSQVRSETLP